MSGPYYVYALKDPRTSPARPFYIGKGKGNRVHNHESAAKNGCIHPRSYRIREIWTNGRQYERRICREFELEADALSYERRLIGRFGIKRLTNLSPGGSVQKKVELPIRVKDMLFAIEALRVKHQRLIVEFNLEWRRDKLAAKELLADVLVESQEKISQLSIKLQNI